MRTAVVLAWWLRPCHLAEATLFPVAAVLTQWQSGQAMEKNTMKKLQSHTVCATAE